MFMNIGFKAIGNFVTPWIKKKRGIGWIDRFNIKKKKALKEQQNYRDPRKINHEHLEGTGSFHKLILPYCTCKISTQIASSVFKYLKTFLAMTE